MKSIITKLISLLLMIFVTVSCTGGEMESNKVIYSSLKDVPDSAWDELFEKKIFFGHQSVGNNIIAGIEDLIKENPKIKLNIIELKDIKNIKDSKNSFLMHVSNLGKNHYPETKIEDFHNYMIGGLGKELDIASMKFCFVDIDAKTDINNVFKIYKEEIENLKTKFPKLKIIHFTVPLLRQSQNSGLKDWIKKILGKSGEFFANEHNIARNQFNDLILNEYNQREPVFNIAEVESTYPDGTRCFFNKDGKNYYSLVPKYTDDGGHLNELGRKIVAEQFLIMLLNI